MNGIRMLLMFLMVRVLMKKMMMITMMIMMELMKGKVNLMLQLGSSARQMMRS